MALSTATRGETGFITSDLVFLITFQLENPFGLDWHCVRRYVRAADRSPCLAFAERRQFGLNSLFPFGAFRSGCRLMVCRGADRQGVGVGHGTPNAMVVGDKDWDVTALVGVPSRVARRTSTRASHSCDCRGGRLMRSWYSRGGDHR